MTPFYRYNFPAPSSCKRGLHDKYSTALSLSSIPSGYKYDLQHGCIITNPSGCNCALVPLYVYYKYDSFWQTKDYLTTVDTTVPSGYILDSSQSLWCVPKTSPPGTCGATVLLERYYNPIDVGEY